YQRFERLLPQSAQAAVEMIERSGEPALAEYLSHLQQSEPVMAYFFDNSGAERTHRWAPASVREVGMLALRFPGMRRGGNGEIAGVQVVGNRGHTYALVLVLPHA